MRATKPVATLLLFLLGSCTAASDVQPLDGDDNGGSGGSGGTGGAATGDASRDGGPFGDPDPGPGDDANGGDPATLPCDSVAETAITRTWASTELAGNEPALTLDGVLSDASYWAAEGNGEWIAYELSGLTEVRYVRFAFYAESIRYFDLQVSLDQTTWTNVLTDQASQGDNANTFERFDFAPACARYVRFVGHGSNVSGPDGWNAVVETDINGFAVDLGGVSCGDTQCEGSESCVSCPEDCGPCTTAPIEIIFSQDFEHNTLAAPYVWSEWTADFNVTWADGIDITDIVSFQGTQCMRCSYQEGTWGPQQIEGGPVVGNGVNIVAPITGNYVELYLSYNLWYETGWTWAKGSKMPGFNAGEFDTSPPPDYIYEWSWGAGIGNQTMGIQNPDLPGHLMGYVYHHDKGNQEYGEGMSTGHTLDVGRWTNVTVRAVLNTIGATDGDYNGILELFVDGVLVGGRTNYRFRNTPDIYLDTMKLYNFMGGGDDSYAPDHDQYNWWDDIVLFYYTDVPENAGVPRGNTPSPAGRVLDLPNWPK